ncbi:Alpha,alpha-trehalose-phosphate synthase UDP-forming A [Porphyridium purpureum]|uniref:Alpha,alpha-trehalose-phosphate synthase UDP-forming A n=1 Tax=Porphyridium purpureum TaxID=35688 RepID=A0A5J4YY28_PORPP|nr:Alpha,alpha-trehalose-phosphate synthase UDP-forming A [Porphyridium purpureum]|eukprot:POR5657..scf209_3
MQERAVAHGAEQAAGAQGAERVETDVLPVSGASLQAQDEQGGSSSTSAPPPVVGARAPHQVHPASPWAPDSSVMEGELSGSAASDAGDADDAANLRSAAASGALSEHQIYAKMSLLQNELHALDLQEASGNAPAANQESRGDMKQEPEFSGFEVRQDSAKNNPSKGSPEYEFDQNSRFESGRDANAGQGTGALTNPANDVPGVSEAGLGESSNGVAPVGAPDSHALHALHAYHHGSGEEGILPRVICVVPRLPLRVRVEPQTLESSDTSPSSATNENPFTVDDLGTGGLGAIGTVFGEPFVSQNSVLHVGSVQATTGDVDVAMQERCRRVMLETRGCFPVFLSEELRELAFNLFVYDTLWPLFHYVPPSVRTAQIAHHLDHAAWEAYVAANNKYAEAVVEVYRAGDVIWIYDLELMLLPALLRKRLRDVTIGFYLSTPVPASEVFRTLPFRQDLLEAAASANLIGFHAHDYVQHFKSMCTRLLGLETNYEGVFVNRHFVRTLTVPMGVEAHSILTSMDSDPVKARVSALRERFHGIRVFLAVDRVNYTKGIPHKLIAFEHFLRAYPHWKDQVKLVLIAFPSRTQSEDYKQLLLKVQELVGRINGMFGSVGHSPILFINQRLDFDDLVAFYTFADVFVTTSLRDSLSTVSCEYIVAQRDNHGVLIFSEFAGSLQIAAGAVRVNPWNIEELADAYDEALLMRREDREAKHRKLFRYVVSHSAEYWGARFVKELYKIDAQLKNVHHNRQTMSSSGAPLFRVDTDFVPLMHRSRANSHKLFFFEYEGALCDFQTLPELCWPSETLLQSLLRITTNPLNSVFIFSSRSTGIMDVWFPDSSIGLIAESGCEVRMPYESTWQPLAFFAQRDLSWMEAIRPILEYFAERTPGSKLEIKNHGISWHYRDSDPVFGSWQAKELRADISESFYQKLPIQVVDSHKMIEIRPLGVSKLTALQRILTLMANNKPGVVFALCGTEKGDEDLYDYLAALASRDSRKSASYSSFTTGGPHGGEMTSMNSGLSRLAGMSRDMNERAGSKAVNLNMAMTAGLTPVSSVVSLSNMVVMLTHGVEIHTLSCGVGRSDGSSATRYLPDVQSAVDAVHSISLHLEGRPE